MPKSMTGFGKGIAQSEGLTATVEIKSVNHRYFEFSCRLPRAYQFLEEKLKNFCQQSITRGKIELSVFIEETDLNTTQLEINRPYADAYITALRSLAKEYRIKDDLKLSAIAGNTELFKLRKVALPDELVAETVLSATDTAVKEFIAMRSVEGERLAKDILSRADTILEKVSFVEERSPETVKAYRERLEQKIRELIEDVKVDEQRLITETAIFADKVAVAEETVRLRSHINQLDALLKTNDSVGKKLDFIVQEMNRETNTIGSKAQDIEIAHTVVDMKAEIEKIREQVQNIE